MRLFKQGRYRDAVTAFQKSADLNDDDAIPHLYLGIGLSRQFVPEAIPPLHAEAGVRAEEEFQQALALDPKNWPALVLLGRLLLGQRKFDAASVWYRRALDLDSANADTACTLGVIAWRQWREDDRAAELFFAGISDLQRTLALEPLHFTAMAYLEGFYRDRAQMPDDVALAGHWRERAELAQREKQRMREAGDVAAWPPALAGTYQVLSDSAWSAVQNFRPPVPPPPPPPRLPGQIRTQVTKTPAWNFRHRPDEREPPPILVNPAAQERMLLTKIDPVSSSGWAEGADTMRLSVVVGKDGHVITAKVIGADSPLGAAAVNAVMQWIYQPTLSNWEPVEVRSEVEVNVTMPR